MSGFKEFLLKTNALALAVAVILGVALNNVVTSLVNDIIMPPIGMLLGGIDFSAFKIVLKDAVDKNPAVSINYGTFLNWVITFVIIALVCYLIAKALIKEPAPDPVKNCPFCKTDNAVDATKCKACASAI